MSINDFGSPKLSGIKLLFDELYPLAVCNTISVSVDSPAFNIAVVCTNPGREVTVKIGDDGKVHVRYFVPHQNFLKEGCFELCDPRCSVRVLDFILKSDEVLFGEFKNGLGLVLDRWGDIRRRVGPLLGD